jgi:hypothetical protein
MAACTPSIHVFLGHPLFLLSSGIHSISNQLFIDLTKAYDSVPLNNLWETIDKSTIVEPQSIVPATIVFPHVLFAIFGPE